MVRYITLVSNKITLRYPQDVWKLVAIGLAIALIVAIAFQPQIQPPGFQLYYDSACTQPVDHIDWGNVTIGTYTNRTFYLKSNSTKFLIFGFRATNFNISGLANMLKLYWTLGGTSLDDWQPQEPFGANEVRPVTFSITFESSAWVHGGKGFSFDILVDGETVGDFNQDNYINGTDLALLQANYGNTYQQTTYYRNSTDYFSSIWIYHNQTKFDINADFIVDAKDLYYFGKNFEG